MVEIIDIKTRQKNKVECIQDHDPVMVPIAMIRRYEELCNERLGMLQQLHNYKGIIVILSMSTISFFMLWILEWITHG